MGNDYFQFKEFRVEQDRCAMKVNTDGCVLGAWADHPEPKRILDIGTGTGVIALMLAQRFPEAQIDAVEVDEDAARQASENFKNSPWSKNIRVWAMPIQDFIKKGKQYDLVVSNPPYYAEHTPAQNERRQIALHRIRMDLDDLAEAAGNSTADEGHFCVILPPHPFEEWEEKAERHGLHLRKQLHLHHRPSQPLQRVVALYTQTPGTAEVEYLFQRESNDEYSKDFAALLKDFYLQF